MPERREAHRCEFRSALCLHHPRLNRRVRGVVERVHHAPMPGNSADLWSWFSFVEPLFKVSNAGRVNDEDVWTLSPFFTHRNLLRKYLQYTSE